MPSAAFLTELRDRSIQDLDECMQFNDHDKTAWRVLQMWAADGNKLEITPGDTGKRFTQDDLVGLSQYYITERLAPWTLQRLTSTFESFFFELLKSMLIESPGKLGDTKLKLSDIIAKGRNFDAVLEWIVDQEVRSVAYTKPQDWFDYLSKVKRLGCPSNDEVQRFAEMKATRDVYEHNKGVVNKTYETKSGTQARYKEGEDMAIPDTYLRGSWRFLRETVRKMIDAAIKLNQS